MVVLVIRAEEEDATRKENLRLRPYAADSIPMGAVKMKDTGATADVGWEKSDNSEHFYVKFINWGTIYRPPQEFIYATGREADAELQKIAEQEYQSYLDNTLK